MNKKHSPLPWRVGDAGATVFGPKTHDGSFPKVVASRLRGDDSRFIVRACNLHYELLDACEAMLKFLSSNCAMDNLENQSAMAKIARDAISKAKGA